MRHMTTEMHWQQAPSRRKRHAWRHGGMAGMRHMRRRRRRVARGCWLPELRRTRDQMH